MRAIRHAQSAQKIEKAAGACASDINIWTVPQRERSGQSHERFARAHARFSENIAHTSKNENWQCRKRCSVMFCLGFGQLFLLRSTKYCAGREKWARGIWSAAVATRNRHHVPNQKWRWFHKTRLSILSTRRPSSPNTAPATKNDL